MLARKDTGNVAVWGKCVFSSVIGVNYPWTVTETFRK